MWPALRFIVQMSEPALNSNGTVAATKADDFGGRITVQKRTPAAVQKVTHAAAYILRQTTLSELTAHLSVLRANAMAKLILAPPLLPEPGTVDPDVEVLARLRDLSRLQLTNECGLELGELLEMVDTVHDDKGRLVVVNKLRAPDNATVALGVKYQAYVDDLYTAELTVV